MRQFNRSVAIFGITILFWNYSMAQEEENKEAHFHPSHELALAIAHAHVFEGRDAEGKRAVLSLPAWGIDYNFRFHPKWAIGLHTDLIVEKFKVEKTLESGGHGEVIERSFPIAPAVVGVFKPTEHWSFLLGMGGEFAKEENFLLSRVGVEYGVELPREWEVFGTFGYDLKWNAYDSWSIGIGIAKKLGKSEK